MSGHRREFHMRHLAHRPHAVYVVWGGDNGDQALYVGMTSDWWRRVGAHMHYLRDGEAVHIDVWHVAPSRTAAEVIEERTIRDLNPRDNVQHSPSREQLREDWLWYSAWHAAYAQGFDRSSDWAREPAAMIRALRVLIDHGYHPDSDQFGPAQTAAHLVAALSPAQARAS